VGVKKPLPANSRQSWDASTASRPPGMSGRVREESRGPRAIGGRQRRIDVPANRGGRPADASGQTKLPPPLPLRGRRRAYNAPWAGTGREREGALGYAPAWRRRPVVDQAMSAGRWELTEEWMTSPRPATVVTARMYETVRRAPRDSRNGGDTVHYPSREQYARESDTGHRRATRS